jgi:hypothetical protein
MEKQNQKCRVGAIMQIKKMSKGTAKSKIEEKEVHKDQKM